MNKQERIDHKISILEGIIHELTSEIVMLKQPIAPELTPEQRAILERECEDCG